MGRICFTVKLGVILICLIPTVCAMKDVVFAVERSSRVSSTDFLQTIDFIFNVTQLLTFGQNATLMSVVTFSSSVRVEFSLDDHADKPTLLTAIDSLREVTTGGDETYTHLAFDVIKQYVLDEQHGARSNANTTVVVLTKGLSNKINSTLGSEDTLRKDGIEIVCIGIGPLLTSCERELEDIANQPASKHVFIIESIGLMPSLVPVLVKILETCSIYGNITRDQSVNESTAAFSVVISSTDNHSNVDILVTVFVVIGIMTVGVFICLIKRMMWKPCKFEPWNKYSSKMNKYQNPARTETDLSFDGHMDTEV